jgi:predicted dehydrogenase
MKKLRWGILGAASIARKNWRAFLNSGNSVITALAARDKMRAEQFVRECQSLGAFEPAPKIFGSYEQLLASPDVDAVYVPLPTALRKEWVIRAAQAGKHVLCEKPCGIHAADVREMIQTCVRNQVQFMDGVMFMHNPRLAAIRSVVGDSKRIGKIRRIESTFSFAGNALNFHENIRVQSTLEPAGSLGDLGWYCIRITLFAKNWELPAKVSGRIIETAADGVTPTQFSGELFFNDGSSAGFFCSFVIESQQWVSIMGERGTVRMADFVHPQNSYEAEYEINQTSHRVGAPGGTELPIHAGALSEFGHALAQDTLMIRNFAAQIQSGKLNEDWPEIALKTQQVMDACLESGRNGARQVSLE